MGPIGFGKPTYAEKLSQCNHNYTKFYSYHVRISIYCVDRSTKLLFKRIKNKTFAKRHSTRLMESQAIATC